MFNNIYYTEINDNWDDIESNFRKVYFSYFKNKKFYLDIEVKDIFNYPAIDENTDYYPINHVDDLLNLLDPADVFVKIAINENGILEISTFKICRYLIPFRIIKEK